MTQVATMATVLRRDRRGLATEILVESGAGYGYHSVLAYGAVGDGTTDDSAAIAAAVDDLADGDTLFFPAGSYRFADASPTGGAAILLDGIDDVTFWFAPGAELLMDNLDGSGHGTSHGIYVRGACSNVRIENARVRWATAPSARSTGDGIHVLGYPKESGVTSGWTGSTGTVSDLALIGCEVIGAPQCGAILMGCDRPRVTNFTARETLADGLHHNACRDLRVSGYTGIDTGDDALAFVTYYDDNADAPTEDINSKQVGPFAMATLTDWSNSGSVTGVVARGGSANGVRLSAVHNLSVAGVEVLDKNVGLIIDAGESGGSYSWSYIASRGLVASGFAIKDCDTGVLVRVHNSSGSDDGMWWTFDASMSDLVIRDCTNRQLRVEGPGATTDAVAGVNFRNVRASAASGNVSFAALRDSVVDGVYADGVAIEFFGTGANWTGTIASLADMALQVDNLFSNGDKVTFQDTRGCQIGKVKSENSTADGVLLTRVGDTTINDAQVIMANRGNTGTVRGLLFTTCQNVRVASFLLVHDDSTSTSWRPLEIGGGSATDVSKNVLVERMIYRNAVDDADMNEVIQGGTYAPVNYYVAAEFYNGGETDPVWRTYRFGDSDVVREFAGPGAPDFAAPVGSTYQRTDGGASTSLYVNESGESDGWVAK